MEYIKTSYLTELAPDIVRFLKGLKPIAGLYGVVLALMIVLSLFFQWGFIKYFIDIMMGWTLLSIPFVGVIIISLDKEFTVEQYEYEHKVHHRFAPYKYSRIWGISLCVIGLCGLYCSNNYKKYYSFQCQDFYLEEATGVYHIRSDCKYLGEDEYGNEIDNSDLVKVSGKDLLNGEFELCDACEEWAEDVESEAVEYQFRRR